MRIPCILRNDEGKHQIFIDVMRLSHQCCHEALITQKGGLLSQADVIVLFSGKSPPTVEGYVWQEFT